MDAARGALVLLLVLGAWTGCNAQAPGLVAPPPGGRHVLFIGNSLTASNDLPATVEAIARSAGDTVRTLSVTRPNFALIDHLTGSNALEAIRLGGWDYVVLQQGPTSTGGVCEDSLVLWTEMFAPHIRAAGAQPALFMVWPAQDRIAYFDNVRQAYQRASAAVNGVFLPAGEAWRVAWAGDSTLRFYSGDLFHPSALGTHLAALTIYERLSGRDVRTLPAVAFTGSVQLALPEETVRLLQAAAHDANTLFPAAAPRPPRPRRTVNDTHNARC